MSPAEFRRWHRVLGAVRAGLTVLLLAGATASAVAQDAVTEEVSTRVQQGRIVDVLGEPVPAARLDVLDGEAVIARGASDAEGIYQLRAKALSGAVLRVSAAGKAAVRRPWGGLSRRAVQNIVLEDACAVRGVVVDQSGAVVGNATVVLAGGESFLAVETAADGSYEVPAAPMRRLHLRAWGPSSYAERSLWLRKDTRCDFVLPRESTGRRRVRVHGLPAAALAGARLEVLSANLAVAKDNGRVQLLADGTAEFLPDDTCLLRLIAPGYTAEPRGWIVEPGGAGELVFQVAPFGEGRRGTILTGRVLDPNRRGVAGARLVAEDRLQGHAGSCTTDAEGGFVLRTRLAADGFCRLGIELGDWQFADDETATEGNYSWTEVEADEQHRFELSVCPANILHGELTGRAGGRFTFGEVFVAPSQRPQSLCAELATDRLGGLEIRGLEEGDYMIAAVSARGELATAEVEVQAGRRRAIGKWKWIESGSIDGRVVDKNGRPMPGVEVHLVSPELFDFAGEPLTGRLEATVRSDRHGMFRCHGLHEGSWLVALPTERELDAERVEVAAGRTASVGFTLTR